MFYSELCVSKFSIFFIVSQLPMKVLQGLVRSSSLCSEGVWSVGNALLGVCFSLMRAHCTNGISRGVWEIHIIVFREVFALQWSFSFALSDLSDLLLTISTDYQDIGMYCYSSYIWLSSLDIRDRARFYLQMLLNVSGEKVLVLLYSPHYLVPLNIACSTVEWEQWNIWPHPDHWRY